MPRWLVVPLAFLTVALCLVSFRLFGHELALVPGNPALTQFNKDQPVDDRDVARLRASREQGLLWYEHSETWGELGLALLLQDRHADEDDGRPSAALHALSKSLRRQPVQPHGWLRHALALRKTEAASEAVAAALLLSVSTGPYTVEILAFRLRLLLQYAPFFVGEAHNPLPTQIRHVWRLAPQQVVDAALRADAVKIVARVLADDREDLMAFARLISRQR